MTSLPQPGHLRSVETGKRPNFERQVTGRHLLYAIPTRKSADLASAGHEYRWTNVEELGQLSRQARYAAVQFMLLVLSPRVRQLNVQVIDCYEPGFKNVYYNRESCCG